MVGKIIKGLSGLGGASALAAGGMFLKDHVVRVNFLKNYDVKVVELEKTVKAANGGDSAEIYFPRSVDPDEFWGWMWIIEVNGLSVVNEPSNYQEFSRERKEFKEEKLWNSSSFTSDIRTKVNNDFSSSPYWEKYKEFCFLWNPGRNGAEINIGGSSLLCFNSITPNEFKNKNEYKKYLKLKEEKKLEISFGEFYWTLWMKFSKNCQTEIKGKSNDSAQILQLFDTWRSDSNTCKNQ